MDSNARAIVERDLAREMAGAIDARIVDGRASKRGPFP
jgi:hypothetical protein